MDAKKKGLIYLLKKKKKRVRTRIFDFGIGSGKEVTLLEEKRKEGGDLPLSLPSEKS